MNRHLSFLVVFIMCILVCNVSQAITYNITDLGSLGGTGSVAWSINNSGQVVGWANPTGNAAAHAFLYSGSTMTDLGTVGGTNSYSYGINASGQVVGTSLSTGNAAHAFLYSVSTMKDLGTVGGTNSYSYGINASGQVVGMSWTAGTAAYHAFLYSGSTMIDLNTQIGPSSGWTLFYAYDINDEGQIVRYGHHGKQDHAFLLTPVPEPSTLILLWSALLGLGWVQLVRRRMVKI